MRKLVLLAAFISFFATGGTAHAATLLSMEDCIDIAILNHPEIAGAAASVAAQEGRVGQSVVADRVTVSGSASTSRVGNSAGENASYSIGATTGIKLFDSNRNRYSVDAAKKTLDATRADEHKTLMDVRSGVKTAYMNLLLGMEVEGQRLESVKAFEHHLYQARGFYEAGSKPWYDVTKAEVDLGSAQLALIEARGNLETARASLLNAMGIEQDEEFEILPASLDISREMESDAEMLALENRADYRSAELKNLAGRSTIEAEARASSPTISLKGGYSGGGDDIFDLGKDWNVGFQMSIPIVDGGETKARVDTARGQLGVLQATLDKLRQDILLDVRKAKADLTNARERMRVAELTLASAQENRRMAEGRYETGVGDPLEVTDALLSLTDASLAKYQAHYDLQMAIIGMESAIGLDTKGEKDL